MSKNKYPLRKIVDGATRTRRIGKRDYEFYVEKLECGHEQSPVTDIYGETNAERRRCKACWLQEKRENRNGVSAGFRNHCIGWYKYRDDHDWRGRQIVYAELVERYGKDAVIRRVEQIAAAITAVEIEYWRA